MSLIGQTRPIFETCLNTAGKMGCQETKCDSGLLHFNYPCSVRWHVFILYTHTHTHTHIHAYIDMFIHSEGLTELLLNSKMHVSLCAESCARIKLKWVLTHGIHISIRDKVICLCMSSCPVRSWRKLNNIQHWITYNTEKNWLPLPRLSSSRWPPPSPSLQS